MSGKDGVLRLLDRETHEVLYEVPFTTPKNVDVPPTVGGVHTCPGVSGGQERNGSAWKAAGGNVLIEIHKERELDDVERRYPADHYVLVDDKSRILAAMKQAWRERVTTVFPRQGHYAHDPKVLASYPPSDVSVDRRGDLLACELRELPAALPPGTTQNGKRQ